MYAFPPKFDRGTRGWFLRATLFVSLSGAGCFGEGVKSRGEGFKGYVRL